MTFGNPAFGVLLIVVFVLSALLALHLRRSHISRILADDTVIDLIVPTRPLLRRRRIVHALLTVIVAFLLVLAILQPRWGFEWRPTERRGFDIVVALDLSDSMRARDISPSRLDRARHELSDLMALVHGDRLGLVSFAGAAYIESPLTLDYGAFRMFLDSLSPDDVPVQGTNIALALEKSLEVLTMGQSLPTSGGTIAGANPQERGKAILLITDGEELQGDVAKVGARLQEAGVKVFVLGIGTADGAPIPAESGYKRDEAGKVILSRLNTDVLEHIARDTGGLSVVSIASDEDVRTLYRSGMQQMLARGDLGKTEARRWHEWYQLPLGTAILLLLFGPWSAGSFRNRAQRPDSAARAADHSAGNLSARGAGEKLSTVGTSGIVAFLVMAVGLIALGAPHQALADSAERAGKVAYDRYQKGEYAEAEQGYSEARKLYGDEYRYLIGEGASAYRQNNFPHALELFSKAAELGSTPSEKASGLYNAGNSLIQENDPKGAIERYEKALALTPNDPDIKANLEYAKVLLKEQNSPQKNQQDNKQNKQQNSQQNTQQNNEQNNEQDNKQNSKQSESQEQQQEQQQQGQQQSQSEQSQSEQSQSDPNQSQEGKQEQDQAEENQSQQSQAEQSKAEQSKSGQNGADQSQAEQNQSSESKSGGSDQSEKQEQERDASDRKGGAGSEPTPNPTPTPASSGKSGEDQSQHGEKKEEGDAAQSEGRSQGDESGNSQQEESDQSESDGSRGAEQSAQDRDTAALLDSVEEHQSSRRNYRYKKGVAELKSRGEKPSRKDW